MRKSRTLKLKKNPATAELIGWVLLLQRMNFDFEKLGGNLTDADVQNLKTSFSVLGKNQVDLDKLKNMV